ncbi:hypothetical protein A3C59_02835 [Candidatus Daviesbacteria bacterium RIFCSPHIGHO2_02_FULL_36_13]|uniref:Uncharacterized protein n=1 Tax=Candidatus Daviesbacteria bacterium RIFCSPHIGHO2_02_FULL_36_13 TaxID=1797768 RepID=A0A1F5JWS2_9BACT|nr:MAG: hypothetical protein A3C59_02835 [Candidatus Daviesbacteria bacterium RIFCSPHIGHO2_02_FULL_36_13]OGE42724.1 MAG: hypothetical protein A3A45_03570 [Candidatus Daviesbacteria bacterium RIFCSPLOWO2_01_FULL_36_8]
MNDPKWLRVMTVGLILAALAIGYFLIAGKFSKPAVIKDSQVQIVEPSASPSANPSAYNLIVERNLQDVTTLPNTAFPASLMFVFSAGAIAVGLGLKRFPK